MYIEDMDSEDHHKPLLSAVMMKQKRNIANVCILSGQFLFCFCKLLSVFTAVRHMMCSKTKACWDKTTDQNVQLQAILYHREMP